MFQAELILVDFFPTHFPSPHNLLPTLTSCVCLPCSLLQHLFPSSLGLSGFVHIYCHSIHMPNEDLHRRENVALVFLSESHLNIILSSSTTFSCFRFLSRVAECSPIVYVCCIFIARSSVNGRLG